MVRNSQGEYAGATKLSPWIAARIMQRGAVSPERRRRAESSASRVARGYEILLAPVDEDGTPVTVTASSVLECEAEILASPTLEISGEPELLNDGEERIGWLLWADAPKDRS